MRNMNDDDGGGTLLYTLAIWPVVSQTKCARARPCQMQSVWKARVTCELHIIYKHAKREIFKSLDYLGFTIDDALTDEEDDDDDNDDDDSAA